MEWSTEEHNDNGGDDDHDDSDDSVITSLFRSATLKAFNEPSFHVNVVGGLSEAE